jgi:putative glutamine amidotransferase
MTASAPIIGITADVAGDRFTLGRRYAELVSGAGGTPVILPCCPERIGGYLRLCAGVILSGGDDPDMTQWDVPTHAKATPIDPARQAFETALLRALDEQRDRPVLGICLGMQLMALHAGGVLDQFLPDSLPTAADHWGRQMHPVTGDLGEGSVCSHHRQAITDPGALRVVAVAHDGVIEAVQADDRRFYIGVQWHPERSDEPALGRELVGRLVEAAGR